LSITIQENNIYLGDCLDLMKQIPDKSIDCVITDPPYGIGEDGGDKKRNRGYNRIVIHEKLNWDNAIPTKEYFDEIFRISKNQIIFGANYFVEYLKPSMGWIFWDKMIGGDFSDGELAYTSFKRALRKIQISYHHGLSGGHDRTHPTQKPVALFKWLVEKYTNENDLILDPFLGSGTTAIACYDLKRRSRGIEKEPKYYEIAKQRIDTFKAQGRLF